MIRYLLFALLLAAAPVTAGERPLETLAARVPANASGPIILADPAAARREAGRVIALTDQTDRALAGFFALSATQTLAPTVFGRFPDGGRAALGFSIFDIAALAAFGEPPDAPLIARIPGIDPGRVGAALGRRGFARDSRAGLPVWSIQPDNATDLERRMSDPFAGMLGQPRRFLIDGETLLFARSWKMLDRLLSPGRTLADDPEAAAILAVGYGFDAAGSLIEAMLLPGPVMRVIDPTMLMQSPGLPVPPGFELPGLPPFSRYAILKWQDAGRLTGAIAIAYPDRATAELARDRFSALLGRAVSPMAQQPLDAMLPPTRAFRVVNNGQRAVLLLSFSLDISGDAPLGLGSMQRNPGNRLVALYQRRELELLIGMGKAMTPDPGENSKAKP